MSDADFTFKWFERASDWSNPILVKETRQAFKSRQFVITFLLLLVVSWLISVFGMLIAGDAIQYGATGRAFFCFYYAVLSTAIFVVVPYSAYRSLLNERDQNTFDLLNITTLTPRQIVWGKLLSALVQVFIFYSAIAPFIAFTSLLQGFDVAHVAFVLVVSMLVSLGLSMITLMFSTVARQRHLQALMSLLALGGLIFFQFVVLSITFQVGLMADNIPFDDPKFWWGMGYCFVAVISFLLLAQQITIAQLTFESDNRSTAIRITCSVQFWLFWTGFFAYWYFNVGLSSLDNDVLYFMIIMSGLFLTAIGIFSATESDYLSRRVRRNLPRRRVGRLLLTPLLPGGGRGFIYLTGHLAALWLLTRLTVLLSGDPLIDESRFALAMSCYIIIYIGLGSAIGRWGRLVSSEIRPAHSRVLILLLFAAGAIGPFIPILFQLVRITTRYTLLHISNPIATLLEFERSGTLMESALQKLTIAAICTLCLNLRACIRGFADILTACVKPRTQVEARMAGIDTNGETSEAK